MPLAILGTLDADGFLRRFLGSWLAVIAIAIPVGWITGWFPPDRIVTFGFAVPIGAAISLVWILRRHHTHPWVTRVVVVVLAGWMIVGALLAWGRQAPFVSVREANVARAAMLRVSGSDIPIVVIVDDPDASATFLGARAANILRAASAPDRAEDVHVVVGSVTDFFDGRPTRRGDAQYDALARLTFEDATRDLHTLVFVLEPFYRGDDLGDATQLTELEPGLWSSQNLPELSDRQVDPMSSISGRPHRVGSRSPRSGSSWCSPSSGLGYARASFDDRAVVLGTAPAFGAASLSLVALLLDRLGLRLQEVPVALAASALAGLGGLALFLVVQRQRDRRPPA